MAMENKNLSEPTTSGRASEKIPYNWTAKERFEAILESSHFSKEDLAEYCRKKGIFPHHLATWKKEFIEASNNDKQVENHGEIKILKNEKKKL